MKNIVPIIPIRSLEFPKNLPDEDDNHGVSNLFYILAFEGLRERDSSAAVRRFKLCIEHYMLYIDEKYC